MPSMRNKSSRTCSASWRVSTSPYSEVTATEITARLGAANATTGFSASAGKVLIESTRFLTWSSISSGS